MGQRSEKYARWKERSVTDLQEQVKGLQRDMNILRWTVRHQNEELETLQGQMTAMRIAGREKEWLEARRRQQRQAMRSAREEQRRIERSRRQAVVLFFLIVIGALAAILLMPEPEMVEQPQEVHMTAVPVERYMAETLAAPVMVAEEPAGRYGSITEEEKELLARLVWAEARGESAVGQQAVAEVVLNRRAAGNFPNSIREVIFEGHGTSRPQFSTAALLDQAEPTAAQYEAVERALQGANILPMDVVYFSRGAENDRVWGTIGKHVFCYQYIWM